MSHQVYARGQVLLAPMEGVTDAHYREKIGRLYPEWDNFCTDFLRAPSEGQFRIGHILEHYGENILNDPILRDKTTFQIMGTARTQTLTLARQIQDLGITKLDLNLGCPSRTVNNHGGGAILLGDTEELRKIVGPLRETFRGTFSVKIRIGVHDDSLFIQNLKLMESIGVDYLTLHARTRDQMYKGRADWEYILKAVQTIKIPVIGNGDVWLPEDIPALMQKSGCHAVMCARGALKTPWLAREYKQGEARSLDTRRKEIYRYFQALIKDDPPEITLKQFKSLSRYLFEDFDYGEGLKRVLLRTQELRTFMQIVQELAQRPLTEYRIQPHEGQGPQESQEQRALA